MTSPSTASNPATISPGSDGRELFRAAYENRYTWDAGFKGYKGICRWHQGEQRAEGTFEVSAELKSRLEGITDPAVEKAIAGQLWEVTIHRVRRSFEQTHGENSFTAGDTDAVGLEIIVGGKGAGDRYRIANNVVTMVHRHIHGTVVTIFTQSTTDTGAGYLSHTYTSRYSDPSTGEAKGPENHFTDDFVTLPGGDYWVLEKRVISTADGADNQTFEFLELQPLG
ncbi:MAG: DUF3386 domain-containing protein [Synechococcaceae bacterium WB6_3B_236]|nr:DUF3386 domain-containing protein [Synechococcaceae bacterium WB6_3B_236]